MAIKVITNNRPRELKALEELPAPVQEKFAYLRDEDTETPRLVFYRGAWYDIGDIEAAAENEPRYGMDWDGILSETYDSGVLFRLVGDRGYYSHVICARYYDVGEE